MQNARVRMQKWTRFRILHSYFCILHLASDWLKTDPQRVAEKVRKADSSRAEARSGSQEDKDSAARLKSCPSHCNRAFPRYVRSRLFLQTTRPSAAFAHRARLESCAPR